MSMNETSVSQRRSMGYKQTEVGVIPTEWSVFSISELFDFLRTASNSRADLDDTGIVAYVHYGDLHTRFHHFIDFSRDNVPRLLPGKSVTATRLRDGDLIVADASEDEAGVGKSVEVRNLGATEAVSGLHTFLLRSKDRRVQHGYRGYLLEKEPVKEQLLRLATGLKVFGISKRSLRDVRIPLPPFSEQRAIAEALSDVDELLAALEELIAKKRAIKQAAMQQLLTGKTRLLGFAGASSEVCTAPHGCNRTDIGGISVVPEGWHIISLGDVCRIQTGKRDVNEGNHDGEYPFFTCSREHTYSDNYSFHTEAILVAGNGEVGNLQYFSGKFEAYQRTYVLSDFHTNVQFLWHQMNAHLRTSLGIGTIGSSIPYIKKENLLSFKFASPLSPNEQTDIANVLSDMDAEIDALERRRDKTRTIKQGMMQQLLTGRVRLIRPETRSVGRTHNWQFNEAVVISVLAKHFGNEQYPLGRMRYTKLSYLLHRYEEGHAEGYLKKAAGPYNPQTRYRGPEKIALEKDYVRQHRSSKGQGFIASTNFDEAESYFDKWYRSEVLQWLEQFRYKTNNDLELLTTVDMAAEELCEAGEEVSVENVKEVIRSHPEWDPKLDRPIFSDANLARAIESCQKLFRRKQ